MPCRFPNRVPDNSGLPPRCGRAAAVHVDYGRIFLIRVEIHGFHHPVIEVGGAVGGFDVTACDFWHVIVFPWVFGSQQVTAFPVPGVCQADTARHGGGRVTVFHVSAICIHATVMYAFAVVQEGTFAVLYAYLIYIGLQRMDFVAAKKQAFLSGQSPKLLSPPIRRRSTG